MNGIIIVDKPAGFTSHDVVAKLRGILGMRRIGHGGTLDPMATGVLPVFVGSATKAVDLLPDRTKRYTATVRLGEKTDTGDSTGAVTAKSDARCTEADLTALLPSFLGARTQIPPMYSAVKVGGRRLYESARAGETVERKPRPIEILSLDLVSFDDTEGSFVLDVRCSKGTYIRVLAEEIAETAGCLGTLTALRRTMSAGFALPDAHTLEEIAAAKESGALDTLLLPVDRAFTAYKAVALDPELTKQFFNGVVFDCRQTKIQLEPGETYCVYGADGAFLGLGENAYGYLKKTCHLYFGDESIDGTAAETDPH